MSGETPEVLISLTRWVRLRCGRSAWVTAAPMPIKPPKRIWRSTANTELSFREQLTETTVVW